MTIKAQKATLCKKCTKVLKNHIDILVKCEREYGRDEYRTNFIRLIRWLLHIYGERK